MSDKFIAGEWNALCSMCSGHFKASELKKHWQGQWRCSKCWEPRHPQDFVTAVTDTSNAVPFVQKTDEVDVGP